MYVDYHFPQVGEVRAERYLQNFYTTEAMRDQRNKLQSTKFDEELKSQIIGATDQALNQIAEQGDYENMTTAVSRASTEYNKLAAPITKNLQDYTAYRESLEKDYAEGKLNYRDFSRTLAYNDARYTGLQMDENGNATNYFSQNQIDPVYDPNIPELMYKALDNLVPDAQVIKGSHPEPYGDGSKYAIQTTDGIKYVDASRVDGVMSMVMSEPAVENYLQRGVLLDTFDMSPEAAQQILEQDAAQMEEVMSAFDAAIAEENRPVEKGVLLSRRQRAAAAFAKLQQDLNSGDPLQALQQQEYLKQRERYISGAEDKYTFSQTEQEQNYTYNEAWLAKFKAGLSAENKPGTKLTFYGDAYQYESGLGSNTYEVVNNMREIDNTIEQMLADKEKNGASWTADVEQQWQAEMDDQLRQLELHGLVMSEKYGITSESDLYNDPGYQEAVKEYEQAVAQYTRNILPEGTPVDSKQVGLISVPAQPVEGSLGAGIAKGEGMKRIAEAQRKLESWLENNAMADPEGSMRETEVPVFHTPASVYNEDQAESLNKWVKSNWSSPPNLMAFTENASQQRRIPEILGNGNWELYGDIGVNRFLPGVNSPTLLVKYREAKSGEAMQIKVPMTQAGIDTNEMGIAYTPYDSFVRVVEPARLELKEYPIDIIDRDGVAGKALVKFGKTRSKDQVIITFPDRDPVTTLYDSKVLQGSFNNGLIRLGTPKRY
jgi:uncharacterized protein (DUF1330 family)